MSLCSPDLVWYGGDQGVAWDQSKSIIVAGVCYATYIIFSLPHLPPMNCHPHAIHNVNHCSTIYMSGSMFVPLRCMKSAHLLNRKQTMQQEYEKVGDKRTEQENNQTWIAMAQGWGVLPE